MPYKCEDCHQIVTIGDWPYCPHGKAQPSKGYEAYFDVGLGQMITTPGDVNAACRPYWQDDHIVKLEKRDRPAGFDAELRDRREARREAERARK